MSFNIQFENQAIVARALVSAGFGRITQNGNRFETESEFAGCLFEHALAPKLPQMSSDEQLTQAEHDLGVE